MNYVLEYPTWYIAICLLCGLLYAFILYRKERLLDEVPTWLKWSMGIFRFTSVSMIALMLLGLLIKKESKVIEKPIIVVGHDNSLSLILNKDSVYYQSDYRLEFDKFIAKLRANYQVEYFTFGDELESQNPKLDFSAKQSNLALFLSEVSNRFQNRNIGAVVLASDGIYNQGIEPSSLAKSITNTGVYTIALGDTAVVKDILIEKVSSNKVAYLGNDFPVEVIVKADKFKGQSTILELYQNDKLLSSQSIAINQSVQITNHSFRIEAKKGGVQKFVLKLKALEGEFTLDNNEAVFFVDVQNNRQKILLLAHAPHPDLGALKYGIESNDAYEVDLQYANDFKTGTGSYDLAILHQIPSLRFPSEQLINQMKTKGVPLWFILGGQTNFAQFNLQKTGLTHIGFRGELDPVSPQLNSNFTLFNLTDDIKSNYQSLPIIHVPFGTLKFSNSITNLFTQKVGIHDKGTPLLAFNKWNNTRTAFLTGEGIWRWRIANPDLFKSLIQKITQFLATKEDKSFFRVLGKSEFMENERITFDAEVFNQSYELNTDGTVSMVFTNEAGDEFNYDFTINGRSYRLNAGNLPVGKYTYKATAKSGGKTYEKSGEFSIKEIKIEYANTVANHQMLYNLANDNGGEMVMPNQLDLLYDKITSREDLVDISYPFTNYKEVIDWKWIFFLIVGLLSVEWFLRKRNGAY